jgi:hypothetical protein
MVKFGTTFDTNIVDKLIKETDRLMYVLIYDKFLSLELLLIQT